MEKSIWTTLAVIVGATLFNVLFWFDKQGVNVLIFDLFVLGILFYLNRARFSERPVQILVGGTLLAAVLIILNNSIMVKVVHRLSFMIMVGMVQVRELRFLGSALVLYGLNALTAPIQALKNIFDLPLLRMGGSGVRGLKNLVLSALIAPVFFVIYYNANPHFATIADDFFKNLSEIFALDLNLPRIIFFLLGMALVGAAAWNVHGGNISKLDGKFSLNLQNAEKQGGEGNTLQEIVDQNGLDINLQTGYRNAFNLLILLNILTFLNNILDIQHVWFDSTERNAAEMKNYVHEGTFLLIWGLLLAIGVVLWLFRGQLNFIEKAKILRGVGVAWLVQNALLAASVGMRNWRYIDQFGLAYKRIGVFIFLGLTLYGLWLLYLKINEKRTFFFFISRGAWAIYTGLMLACFVNWDIFITQYNLSAQTQSGFVDVRFLVREVSDKNLYLLYQNKNILLEKLANNPFPDQEGSSVYREIKPAIGTKEMEKAALDKELAQKKDNFEYEQQQYSWFSWNYPDYINQQFFK